MHKRHKQLVSIIFTIGIIYVSDIKISYIYKGVKPVFFLVLITALLNIFLVRGDILLFKWWIIRG